MVLSQRRQSLRSHSLSGRQVRLPAAPRHHSSQRRPTSKTSQQAKDLQETVAATLLHSLHIIARCFSAANVGDPWDFEREMKVEFEREEELLETLANREGGDAERWTVPLGESDCGDRPPLLTGFCGPDFLSPEPVLDAAEVGEPVGDVRILPVLEGGDARGDELWRDNPEGDGLCGGFTAASLGRGLVLGAESVER